MSWFGLQATRPITFRDDEGRAAKPCWHCGLVEDYDRDEQCPCLPVEPPCEEWDEHNDR